MADDPGVMTVRMILACGHEVAIPGDETVCEVAWCGECNRSSRITPDRPAS